MSRMGTKARPFYRMVVANSTEPRGGKFVEILGTYNPVAKPVLMNIKQDRALHWLMSGAQPTETAAVVLNKLGVLDQYFSQRPKAKASYKFLDKRTAAISVKSVMEAPVVEAPKAAPAPAPAPEPEPVVEATETASDEAAASAEAPAAAEAADVPGEATVEIAAADDAPAEEPAAEAAADAAPTAEEGPAEESPAEEKAE